MNSNAPITPHSVAEASRTRKPNMRMRAVISHLPHAACNNGEERERAPDRQDEDAADGNAAGFKRFVHSASIFCHS